MSEQPRASSVLVLGRAKTGTTVISKTIQHSIPRARYFLEPKDLAFFDNECWLRGDERFVVKLIVEHWNTRPEERESIIRNARLLKFSHRVAIVRDPRDEIISRLYYYLLPYIRRSGYRSEQVAQWLDVLREKERNPAAMPVVEMVRRLAEITGDPVSSMPAGIDRIHEYFRLLDQWSDSVHVLHYEDFMRGELRSLQAYLGVVLSDRRDVGDFAWTRRSLAVDNWKRLFTPEDVSHYRQVLAEPMQRYGYADWTLATPERLDPAAGSAYVEALVEKARSA